MKPLLYDILKTNDHAVMVWMVRRRLAQGWAIVGPISTVVENGKTYLFQTMTRFPSEEDENSRDQGPGGT